MHSVTPRYDCSDRIERAPRLSTKQHKPEPIWHAEMYAIVESYCKASGDTDMARRCNRAAALKFYWTYAKPSDQLWYTYHECCANFYFYPKTEEEIWEQEARIEWYEARIKELEKTENAMSTRRRWRDRSHDLARKKRRAARLKWRKIRKYVRTYVIVMWWMEVTAKRLDSEPPTLDLEGMFSGSE